MYIMIHFYNFRIYCFRYIAKLPQHDWTHISENTPKPHITIPTEQLNIGSICIRNKREEKYKTKNKEGI